MRYGAVMEFDLYSENTQADRIVLAKGLLRKPSTEATALSSKHRYSALPLTIKTGKA